MDLNRTIARVKAILLTPQTEWPRIASEPETVADLYKNYILVLAAIPAVIGFISMSLIGISVPLAGTVRIGVMSGLTSAILQYVLSLAIVYVMALIVEALAPTFSAQKDRMQALKVVTYSLTAAWVASIAQLIPVLGGLIALAGLVYTIYLLYIGLPHTMKNPPDKSAGYTALSIVIAIVLGLIMTFVVARVTGVGQMISGSSYGVSNNDVQFDTDSPIGRMEEWGRNLEEAGKKLEAAEKSGDQKAQGEAFQQMLGAALGNGQVEALAPDRLKPFIPESLAGLQRTNFSAQRNEAMGMQISEARATYSNDADRSLELEITDAGAAKGLLALAGWAGVENESESADGFEKAYRSDGRMVHEQWNRSESRGEYAVVLADRFTVEIKGQAESIDELKAALREIDLSALEELKDEGVQKD